MHYLIGQFLGAISWITIATYVLAYTLVQTIAPDFIGPIGYNTTLISIVAAAPIVIFFIKQNTTLTKMNRSLNLEVKRAKLEAMFDPMTNLLNRKYFVRETERRRKNSESTGYFLMIDTDHFKRINDIHGHAIGDKALMKITSVMRKVLREDDVIGRLGGEEFGIYLKNVNHNQAHKIAERLRKQVATTAITANSGELIHVTVSIGAVYAGREQDIEELMRQADRNLYNAKDKGRNCTVFDYAGVGNLNVSAVPISIN